MGSFLDNLRKKEAQRKPKYETDNAIYVHWNADEMDPSVVRFVPYVDKYTQNFYAHKILLPMEFDDPENEGHTVKFNAPCREMYVHNEKCPVAAVVSALYQDAKAAKDNGDVQENRRLRKIGGFHWKNQNYYWQGFVNRCPFKEDDTPENLLRVFPFTRKIHDKLYASLFENKVNPFKNSPTGEYTIEDVHLLVDGKLNDSDLWKFEGIDFILQYSESQGEDKYNDWLSHSSWDREWGMLQPEQIASLVEHGYHDMSKRLPERPSEEQYEVLAEMMQVSIERMQHGSEGVWKQAWSDAGFKFYRIKDKTGDSGKASSDLKPSNVTNRVKSAVGGSSAGGDKTATNKIIEDTMAKLNANRGVEAPAANDTPVVEDVVEDAPAPEAKQDDMRARVQAAMLAKSGSKSA